MFQDDAPAARAEERAGPGFSAFGLGLRRGGREEPWELGAGWGGDGEARAVAETAAATAALGPSY